MLRRVVGGQVCLAEQCRVEVSWLPEQQRGIGGRSALVRDDRGSALGCGCAVLPGLVLGVALYALVGLEAGRPTSIPPVPSGTDQAEVRVALSEPYLSRALSEVADPTGESSWQVDVLPAGELRVQGQVTVKALGTNIGVPLTLLIRVAVANGQLGLTLIEADLPVELDATKLAAVVNPVLDLASRQFQLQLAQMVGEGWRLARVETTEAEVELVLAPGAGQ